MRIATTRWLLGFLVVMFLLVSCDSKNSTVLGPKDKPEIASDQWDSLQVYYWIRTAGPKREKITRKLVVADPAEILLLKSHLKKEKMKDIQGLSVGNGNLLILKKGQKWVWHGEFVFEDRVDLSMQDDEWRSYMFTLKDRGFYHEVRKLCAANERKFHPEATEKHIQLCSNFDDPEQLPVGDEALNAGAKE